MYTTQNYKLILQYDGRPFCGWQRQENGLTVQECLEKVLETFCGHHITVHGSGRTDAGVHAMAQVANFHASLAMTPSDMLRAFNANLPSEIRVRHVAVVPDDFHARFSARQKTYRYLAAGGDIRSPFLPFYVTWLKYSLDVELMKEAAQHFIGTHDFASFMGAGSAVKTTERTIKTLEVSKGGGVISFTISADGFLKHMVRNIVGTLFEVGKGKLKPESMSDILSFHDRNAAGPTAPAEGLMLLKVDY